MSRNQFKTKWFILQSSICKAGFVKLLAVFLLSTVIISGNAFAQYQPPSEGTPAAQRGERTEEYKESALRRFEVVTLISLPFTAIHSFLAVRGVKMIQNGNIAPELSSTDFKIVGVTAVSYALFIGFWDWLHTHGKKPVRTTDSNFTTVSHTGNAESADNKLANRRFTRFRPSTCANPILVMAILEIHTDDAPILRQKASPVERIDHALLKLIDDMFETMHDAKGIGFGCATGWSRSKGYHC